MKIKRLLSAALMLTLLLGTLSGGALAADWPPEDSAGWTNLSLNRAEALLNGISKGDVSEDVVLVYYSRECGSSQSEVPKFIKCAAQNGLQLQGYDGISEGALYGYFRLAQTNRVTYPAVLVYSRKSGKVTFDDGVLSLVDFKDLLAAAGLLASGGGDTAFVPGPETPVSGMEPQNDSSISAEEWEVLRLTNIHRMEVGAIPLSMYTNIQKAGNQRAYEQMTLYSHSRPDGSDCFTALDDCDVAYTTAAENIAMGYRSAAAVVDGWLNSPGHRQNIENGALTHIGVGDSSSGYNWVQIFAGETRCDYSGISLSRSSLEVEGGDLEAALAEADVTVTARCARHGTCTLPLIAGMCAGYDPDTTAQQKLTVTLGGASTSLAVTVVPAPTPTPTPTPKPTPTPAAPSAQPVVTPTPAPVASSAQPVVTPTPAPVAPSAQPAITPTPAPVAPSVQPTVTPTPAPVEPSAQPTPTPANTDKDAWGDGQDDIPSTGIAYASTQKVDIDGVYVEFEMYALKDANGNDTNYIKARDLAYALQGSDAEFDVGWSQYVRLYRKTRYQANGSEFFTPFQGDRSYQVVNKSTLIDGFGYPIQAILLTDDSGGGYTYYKLRDLGRHLRFNVSWSADRGVFVETAKPYKG